MSDRIVIERVFRAPIELVWELWTTADGIASWFGPSGFEVEVQAIDLRAGGQFTYTMRAASAEMAAMMEKQGRPASFSVTSTFTAVEPPHRVAYDSPFGPETMSTVAVFSEVEGGVKLVLELGASKPGMTGGAAMGWKSSLDRLAEQLTARAQTTG